METPRCRIKLCKPFISILGKNVHRSQREGVSFWVARHHTTSTKLETPSSNVKKNKKYDSTGEDPDKLGTAEDGRDVISSQWTPGNRRQRHSLRVLQAGRQMLVQGGAKSRAVVWMCLSEVFHGTLLKWKKCEKKRSIKKVSSVL